MNERPLSPSEIALGYHLRTKHHPRRFAASLGWMDWETQPDPFRRWEGAPCVELPLAADSLATKWGELWRPGAAVAAQRSLANVGAFLELSLGITAWKRAGAARWALRANPSSGNLHPTEGWVVVPDDGASAQDGATTSDRTGPDDWLSSGVHHYAPREHLLEQRAVYAAGGAAQRASRPAGFGVALTSIHWREAWKYGERALRYCQHDVGHAIAGLRIAAAALGWRAALVDELGDEALGRLLGLDRAEEIAHLVLPERDAPETLLWIACDGSAPDRAALREILVELQAAAATATWFGRPNVLSHDHAEWPVIELAARATVRPAAVVTATRDDGGDGASTTAVTPDARSLPRAIPSGAERNAAALIRERRSAVAFDGRTPMDRAAFLALLDAVVARSGGFPWDAWPAPPRVHLLLFVHRVSGLASGIYLLDRSATPAASTELRAAITSPFSWTLVADAPPSLRLLLLQPGDWRETAQVVSCTQSIAADGAFAVAMIARFEPEVRAAAWEWRRLFWECGFLGQLLYLGAQAAGVRATGIGCFFDDLVHELLGLRDATFQSLYHFTVGTPVDDPRLQSEPAYGPDVRARGS